MSRDERQQLLPLVRFFVPRTAANMRSFILSACATAYLLFSSPALTSDALQLDWSRLVDRSAQNYDDPYRELTPEQLVSLVTVARLREKAANGEPFDEQQLSQETASLVADNIDVEGLIAQRWIVAERRERAATAGNKEVHGRRVAMSGFVIPAAADEDGTSSAYLVPERGMCSHMPPPPPNQMVRLRLPENWRPQTIYEPIRVTGLLSIEPTKRAVQIVDGLVPMHATFTMDVSDIEPLGFAWGD